MAWPPAAGVPAGADADGEARTDVGAGLIDTEAVSDTERVFDGVMDCADDSDNDPVGVREEEGERVVVRAGVGDFVIDFVNDSDFVIDFVNDSDFVGLRDKNDVLEVEMVLEGIRLVDMVSDGVRVAVRLLLTDFVGDREAAGLLAPDTTTANMNSKHINLRKSLARMAVTRSMRDWQTRPTARADVLLTGRLMGEACPNRDVVRGSVITSAIEV